jgi:rRNA maturation endonuclease Nob1
MNMEKKETVKEKEIVREVIVKMRCPYCHNVYDETLDKCPHCGAHK